MSEIDAFMRVGEYANWTQEQVIDYIRKNGGMPPMPPEPQFTVFYGVNSGSCYEGGGCGGWLFRTREAARDHCLMLVKESKKERNKTIKYLKEEHGEGWRWFMSRKKIMREEKDRPDYWTDGFDYICIQKFTVKP